jgi:hypothetical protein
MDWAQYLLEPLKAIVDRFLFLLPKVVGALIILIVGWLVARLLRQAIIRLLQALRIDELSDKAQLAEVLRRGAIRLTFVELIAELAYWLVMIACVGVALQFMGMTVAAIWLEQFGYFIPRLVVSIVILLFGMLVAGFLGATLRAASLNAGVPYGHLVGHFVSTTVVLLTVLIALEQLHVVTRTIEVALYILLSSCGLAFALAVGLGSQDVVRQALLEMRERWKAQRR